VVEVNGGGAIYVPIRDATNKRAGACTVPSACEAAVVVRSERPSGCSD
jgi:hypothetical protein